MHSENLFLFVLFLVTAHCSSWKSKIQYLKLLEYFVSSLSKLLFKQYKTCLNTCNLHQDCWFSIYPDGDRRQKVITEKGGYSQSIVSKHINGRLTKKKNIGGKRQTSNKEDCSLEMIVKKVDSRTWRTSQGVYWGRCQCIKSRKGATTVAFLISATPEPETTSEVSHLG